MNAEPSKTLLVAFAIHQWALIEYTNALESYKKTGSLSSMRMMEDAHRRLIGVLDISDVILASSRYLNAEELRSAGKRVLDADAALTSMKPADAPLFKENENV